MNKRAFTMAEVMLVITILGIMIAIILPTAYNSMPNENVVKFKKANNVLGTVIRELASSGKYYLDGDLGVKADGTLLVDNSTNKKYFCTAFADMLSTKLVDCKAPSGVYTDSFVFLSGETSITTTLGQKNVTNETIQTTKAILDDQCIFLESTTSFKNGNPDIITTDGISYYGFAGAPLGYTHSGHRIFSPPNQHPANISDENGFDIAYSVICVDVDGIANNVTYTTTKKNCVNECPFGYGIRADGKILPGARADEWIQKAITDKE